MTIWNRLWRRKPLLLFGFAVALGLTVVFGATTVMKYRKWHAHVERPVAAWMTPGFIARNYRIDVEEVREALGLDPDVRDRRTIASIARDTGIPRTELVGRVQDLLEEREGGIERQ